MRRILLIISLLAIIGVNTSAQVQIAEQQPGALFAYPLAPDTCSTLESRCNFIIAHFWDNFDISKPVTDNVAFEKTFRDYVDFFRYAHRNVVLSSVRDLVNKAQSNTSNLQMLGAIAERALYGPDAEYWSDEVYIAFIKPLAASKQLSKAERERYAAQLASINRVQPGAVLDFEFTGIDGNKTRLSALPDSVSTYILLFVDDSTDSTIGRLRLSTDVAVNQWLETGDVKLLCLSLNKYSSEWAAAAAGFASNWIAGCGESLRQELDLRTLPCCYLLDGERTILSKSLAVDALISAVNSTNY